MNALTERRHGKSRQRWIMAVATVAAGGTVSMFTADKQAARTGILEAAKRFGVSVAFEDVDADCMRVSRAI